MGGQGTVTRLLIGFATRCLMALVATISVTAFADETTPSSVGDTGPFVLDIARFYSITNNANLKAIYSRQMVDGLPFQIGGEAILYGQTEAGVNSEVVYPEILDGIRIGRTFDELHLIDAARWPDVEGQRIARIRLNYADGTSHEFPIVYGGHVRDWQRLRT